MDLPAPERPTKATRFPGSMARSTPVERDVAVGIGEVHVLEADLPERARQRLRAVEDGVLGVEEHEDAVERRRALLHGGEVAAEPPGRAGDHAEAGQEAGEVGDGDGAGADAQADDEEQDRDRDADQHLHHRRHPRLPAVLPGPQAEEPLEDAVGAGGERLLQAVGARHADAGEALGDLGGHRGHLGLGALGEAAQPPADAVDRDERQREDEADADRQRPVDGQHHRDVTTMVRMPVTPPSIERTALPTRPMSEEKRAARPAGASVCSRARSVPTSRANMVLRSSVSMRLVTGCR